MSDASTPVRFLVVDENSDSRFLLVKTLLRKFPNAVLQECQHGDTATAIAKTDKLSAIVVHRTFEYDGATLVSLMRRVNPTVPIVMVSGVDRSAEGMAAGATCFLKYDEWLRIGTVVTDAMRNSRHPFAIKRAAEEMTAKTSA